MDSKMVRLNATIEENSIDMEFSIGTTVPVLPSATALCIYVYTTIKKQYMFFEFSTQKPQTLMFILRIFFYKRMIFV